MEGGRSGPGNMLPNGGARRLTRCGPSGGRDAIEATSRELANAGYVPRWPWRSKGTHNLRTLDRRLTALVISRN